jgi:catechol 2,3-dioxygenase-like lactoylglutathione lyase family enzyme
MWRCKTARPGGLSVLQIINPVVELAIVTRDPEPMLRFYRDVLGLEYVARLDFPTPGGNPDLGVPPGCQHRLRAGGILLKITHCPGAPVAASPPGPAYARTGYRFVSIVVGNLREAVDACRAAGCEVTLDIRCFEGDIHYAFVADPDGNAIELAGPLVLPSSPARVYQASSG